MSAGPQHAARAAKILVAERVPAPPLADAARASAIAIVAGAIRAEKKKRSRARWLVGLAAAAASAAAIVAVTFGVTRGRAREASVGSSPPSPSVVAAAVRGDVLIEAGGRERALSSGDALVAGDRVIARGNAHAEVALPTGTRITLGSESDVSMVEGGATQIFELAGGSMRADVAKLRDGERFVVRTVDAEIEVRGTSFRLTRVAPEADCGGGTTTRLTVYEGVVAVRAAGLEVDVGAGQVWPSGCGLSAPSAQGARSGGERDGAPPVSTPHAASSANVQASNLAAQNDLFARAVAEMRRGDSRAAVASFDRFLQQYPASPLGETAMADRMRVLATTDHARAVSAATQYVSAYPSGFARADADAILGATSQPTLRAGVVKKVP